MDLLTFITLIICALTLALLIVMVIRTFSVKREDNHYKLHSIDEKIDKNNDLIIGMQSKMSNLETSINSEMQSNISDSVYKFQRELTASVNSQMNDFKDNFTKSQIAFHDSLRQQMAANFDGINSKVDNRLQQGFKDTTDTFAAISAKMATLEKATDNMVELNNQVNALNGILNNDKARGKYGEVVLSSILEQVYGQTRNLYKLQYSFDYEGITRRPDAVILLRDNIILCVDAKFPFANFEDLLNSSPKSETYKHLAADFKKQLKEQIAKISRDYVIANFTYEQAIMFIPNDGIYTYIHANFYEEIVQEAMRKNVILSSPSIFQPLISALRTFQLNYETSMKINEIGSSINELIHHFNLLKISFDKYNENIYTALKTGEDLTKKFHTVDRKISNLKNNISDDDSLIPPKIATKDSPISS